MNNGQIEQAVEASAWESITPPQGRSFLSTVELADLTRTKPQTWRKKRVQGGGPPYARIGNRVLYAWPDVVAWLKSKRRFSTAG